MTQKILNGGGMVKTMWEQRGFETMELYRVCEDIEAVNTWFYCLAGGAYRPLVNPRASEDRTVGQVANSEGMPRKPGEPDPRLALLIQLGLKPAAPRERDVVEYSVTPANQFSGSQIKVLVNKNYLTKGTNLGYEGGGGYVAQIGTPLAIVTLMDDKVLERCGPSSYEFPYDTSSPK
jgi:hypothetical protein